MSWGLAFCLLLTSGLVSAQESEPPRCDLATQARCAKQLVFSSSLFSLVTAMAPFGEERLTCFENP